MNNITKYNARPDILLGGIDSIITVMAVIGASFGIGEVVMIPVIVALSLSNVFSDGLSMFLSRYLSQTTGHDRIEALNSGLYTWLAFTIIGLIPIIPFIVLRGFGYRRNVMFTASFVLVFICLISLAVISFDIKSPDDLQSPDKLKHFLEVVGLPILIIFISFAIGKQFRMTRKV